jgi:hypothetical protein
MNINAKASKGNKEYKVKIFKEKCNSNFKCKLLVINLSCFVFRFKMLYLFGQLYCITEWK